MISDESYLMFAGVINKDLQDMRASVALDTEDTARRKFQRIPVFFLMVRL